MFDTTFLVKDILYTDKDGGMHEIDRYTWEFGQNETSYILKCHGGDDVFILTKSNVTTLHFTLVKN